MQLCAHSLTKHMRLCPITCLKMSLYIIRIFPLDFIRLIGQKVGFLFAHLPLRDVKRCREHLKRAFPNASNEWINKTTIKCFGHFGRSALTILRLLHVENKDIFKYIKVEGQENLDAHREAYKNKEGTLLIGGHFGNYELQMRFMGLAGDIYTVGKRLRNENLNNFVMNDLRCKNNAATVIYQDQGLIPCSKALRKGGSVTMVPDQDLPKFPGIFSTWFNIPAYTPSGPAHLARLRGVAVQPVYFYERDGYFVFHWGPRKHFEKTADETADIQQITDWYMAYQEQLVRQYPEQWVWWHKRWRTQPEDIASAND